MLDRNSPIPLYHQLARHLSRDIREGRLKEGDRLPSEPSLAETYGIGRPTVRQAVDSLVRRGLLIRRRGSGTYVAAAPQRVDLFSLAGTSASFLQTGRAPEVGILQQPTLTAVEDDGANPFAGTLAYAFSRVSRVSDDPVLVEDMFLSPEFFPGLETMDMTGRSLARLVEDRYGLTLTGGEQHFRIAYPDERLAVLLAAPVTTPILAVDRYLHFGLAQNAIFARLFCRTDRFVFTQTLGGHPHA